MRSRLHTRLITHVQLKINDRFKTIIKSLVNLQADDTTVYECISQNLDDQILTADGSSELTFTVHWG